MLNVIIKNELENLLYNIVWLRKHYNLSKNKMAKILGISVYSLNKIENGVFPPKLTVKIFENLQTHFNIHPKNIFERRF